MKSGKKKNKNILKENNFWGKVCEIYIKMWAECHKFNNFILTQTWINCFSIYTLGWSLLNSLRPMLTNTRSHTCKVFSIKQRFRTMRESSLSCALSFYFHFFSAQKLICEEHSPTSIARHWLLIQKMSYHKQALPTTPYTSIPSSLDYTLDVKHLQVLL